MAQPLLNLDNFWFGDDDGTDETDNTFLGIKNSNQTLDVDTNYRFRVGVSNTGAKDATVLLQLQYNLNTLGWNNVTGSSSVVRMSASTKLAEGDDCTERLAGAYAFDGTNAGQEDNDGITGSDIIAFSPNTEQEADYCFTIISGDVDDADTITLRVVSTATPLDNYNQTPTITVSEVGATVYYQDVAGGVSFVGTSIEKAMKQLAGAVSFGGSITLKKTLKALVGGVSFVGDFAKKGFEVLAGALGFGGAVATQSKFTKALAGAIGFIGSISKIPKKLLAGGLSFAGALGKKTTKSFAGELSFAGDILKTTKKLFAGELSFSGFLDAVKQAGTLYYQGVAGGLSFAGDISKLPKKMLVGGASFVGTLTKKGLKILIGGLSSVGTVSKKIFETLSGALSFSGFLDPIKQAGTLYFQAVAGSLSFAGDISKLPKKILVGGLSFVGSLIANKLGAITYYKALAGGLSFVGGIRKKIKKSLAGVLTFLGVNTLFVAFRGSVTISDSSVYSLIISSSEVYSVTISDSELYSLVISDV